MPIFEVLNTFLKIEAILLPKEVFLKKKNIIVKSINFSLRTKSKKKSAEQSSVYPDYLVCTIMVNISSKISKNDSNKVPSLYNYLILKRLYYEKIGEILCLREKI